MRIFTIALSIILLAGCAKDTGELAKPDSPEAVYPDNNSARMKNADNAGDLEFPADTETSETAEIVLIEEPTPAEPITMVEPEQEPEPEPEVVPEPEPVVEKVTITPPVPKPEVTFTDSTFESYMIKRDDWLSKIAQHEYGDWRMWEKIYAWNKEKIGSNPNLIYPYHFIDLLKPTPVAKKCEVEFYNYTITKGETLWSIAGKVFGDELAWIILYMDNEAVFEDNAGEVIPGMVIKLRKKLDPCS